MGWICNMELYSSLACLLSFQWKGVAKAKGQRERNVPIMLSARLPNAGKAPQFVLSPLCFLVQLRTLEDMDVQCN